MNDKEYFLKYKSSFDFIFEGNVEDCAFIKDTDLKYQTATTKMLKLFNMDHVRELEGQTFRDMSQRISACSLAVTDILDKQEMTVQKKMKRQTYLQIFNHNGKRKICLSYKTPIINPHTGNCIGIKGHLTNLFLPHVVKTLFKMHGTKGLLMGHKNTKESPLIQYPQSDIQHMTLFLAISNYSYSEIAVLLNEFGYAKITPVRVNDYLEQLKLIFHVRNKTQLIEKAIGLNFHKLLPEGLFNKIGSIEVSNEEAQIIYGEAS
jgi:hypothetical protein